jgi:predicted nucleotidyltransferase
MGIKRGAPKTARKVSRKTVRKGAQASPGLADALFTKSQQRVLGVLFGNPGRSFFATEIIDLAKSGRGAVQRELASLEASGLVTVVQVGKQKHYQANPKSPLFSELRGLAVKTFGLTDVLRSALDSVAVEVRAAFVYGSIAKGSDTAESDVDILVISDTLAYADLFAALEAASAQLGRKVSPTVYSTKDFQERIQQKNSFVTRILAQPKLWLIGDEHVLGP